MFNIVDAGFNDSLDDYLNKRRDKTKLSKSFYSTIKSKKNKESPFGEDEHTSKGSSNWSAFSIFRRRIPTDEEVMQKDHDKKVAQERAEMKDDDEDMVKVTPVMQQNKPTVQDDDDFEDYEDVQSKMSSAPKEKKEGGFMSKLFNFSSKKDDNEREELAMQMQVQQQNIEELKETIKVLHKWLEKLPSDKISEFKRSPDFEKYKQGLRNLGLIKE